MNSLWNLEQKYDENFHNKCYCLFTQFTFKLNSTNTIKEGIHEQEQKYDENFHNLCYSFTQFTFKLNSIKYRKGRHP